MNPIIVRVFLSAVPGTVIGIGVKLGSEILNPLFPNILDIIAIIACGLEARYLIWRTP